MSKLLSPLIIKDIVFRNRIAISPMCQYSAVDGFANDWHLVHLGSRAVGGAALIIQEATAVSPEGRITPADLGIYKEEHIEKLQSIASFINQQGAVAGIQLAHAGRKASCALPWNGGKQLSENAGGWRTVAPSAVAFNPEDNIPKELDTNGILKVIADFKVAASRALQAGYKLIEIHAAHGYLIHQFLSPLSNRRTDEYGGSFENRIRLLLEILKAVQTVWPQNLPLFVRISATDWVEGGWDIDEAIKLSFLLKTNGVDLIDCSSGGLVPHAKIPLGPGYQVAFAERIKKDAGILTGAVGMITEVQQAEDILAKGEADLILIARESLRKPYFAFHAAQVLNDDIEWPLQYLRAKL
ncbi:MAG: NADH:flavin oxidoreductase/NADH oxidase [Prolixibacteraceae bacterium]|nr:NADH:flavin oxidoreductase/NADH oxidase [Prolixibacteraceae bacterium]